MNQEILQILQEHLTHLDPQYYYHHSHNLLYCFHNLQDPTTRKTCVIHLNQDHIKLYSNGLIHTISLHHPNCIELITNAVTKEFFEA